MMIITIMIVIIVRRVLFFNLQFIAGTGIVVLSFSYKLLSTMPTDISILAHRLDCQEENCI